MNGRQRNATNAQIWGKKNNSNYDGNCTARHCLSGTYEEISRRWIFVRPIASRTPSFAHLYVFDSDMETRGDLQCCIMDGLGRAIMVKIQRAVSKMNSFVEILLRAGEFTRNQEVLNGLLASHEAPVVELRKKIVQPVTRWPPSYLTIICEPNDTLFCTSEVGVRTN